MEKKEKKENAEEIEELLAEIGSLNYDEKNCKLCTKRTVFKKREPRLFRTLKDDDDDDETEPDKSDPKQDKSDKEEGFYDKDEFWQKEVPPDIIELGHAGWTLLHSMAAYYPEQPSTEKREEVRSFLKSFANVYPCHHCATDFQRYIRREPPTLGNRREFSLWACRAHNHVNKRLGKPEFPCERVDERWRLGDEEDEEKEREIE
jgi:hypothetical protein